MENFGKTITKGFWVWLYCAFMTISFIGGVLYFLRMNNAVGFSAVMNFVICVLLLLTCGFLLFCLGVVVEDYNELSEARTKEYAEKYDSYMKDFQDADYQEIKQGDEDA